MSRSPRELLACKPEEEQARWLAAQEEWVLREIHAGEWWWVARSEQRAPAGAWLVWLILAGRGFGKTRTCAEWVIDRALTFPVTTAGQPTNWLVAGESLSDAMAFCVRGEAGIMRVLRRRLGQERRGPYDKTGKWRLWRRDGKPVIEMIDGQSIYIEGADDEDVGRGHNLAGVWLDEFAKWPKPDGAWQAGIMPSLRQDILGDHPRAVVATTPRLVMQLIEWEDRVRAGDTAVRLTTGSTYENAPNLSALMLAEMHRLYAGTRLGQQELEGKLLREVAGALWSLGVIEASHVAAKTIPELTGIVVAMDAAGSDTGALTGLVAAGRGVDELDYVLGDWSKQMTGTPAARRAWEMYLAYGADLLLVEKNQGQAWLIQVLTDVYKVMQKERRFPPGGSAPIRPIDAKIGKKLRAQPVAARYEQRRVKHVLGQGLGDLETQQVTWVPEKPGDSPDRVDALVYCILYLASRERLAASLSVAPADALSGLLGNMGPLGAR